jgi:hypothetical protein
MIKILKFPSRTFGKMNILLKKIEKKGFFLKYVASIKKYLDENDERSKNTKQLKDIK